MGRFSRRNKRWAGVNELSGKDSKHGSTKTRNVKIYWRTSAPIVLFSCQARGQHSAIYGIARWWRG